MIDKLELEQLKLQERIKYHDQLLSERARLDNLLNQNQAAILILQGRIQMLQELIAADTDVDNAPGIINEKIYDVNGNLLAQSKHIA